MTGVGEVFFFKLNSFRHYLKAAPTTKQLFAPANVTIQIFNNLWNLINLEMTFT